MFPKVFNVYEIFETPCPLSGLFQVLRQHVLTLGHCFGCPLGQRSLFHPPALASVSLSCKWEEQLVLSIHLLGSEQGMALRLGSVALGMWTWTLSPDLLLPRCLLSSLNLEHPALSITIVSEGPHRSQTHGAWPRTVP